MNAEPPVTSDPPLPADLPAAAPADLEASTDAPAVGAAVAVADAAPDAPSVEPALVADAPLDATAEPVTATTASEPGERDEGTPTPADGAPSDAGPPAAAPAAPDLSPAATGTRLAALFPALFVGPDGKGVWKPIKLRIHADIQARAPGEFSKRTLGIFFSRYTTTTPYLKALAAEGAQRFDLDGQPAGEISPEHRQLAVEEVARRQAIAAERRAAMRPPRREPPAARRAEGPAHLQPGQEGEPDGGPASGAEAGGDRPPPRRAEGSRPPAARPREGGPRADGPVRREPGPRPLPRGPEAGHRAQERPPGPGPQGNRPPHLGRTSRPARDADAMAQAGRGPRPQGAPAPHMPPREPAFAPLPTDPAQRERAMLLRAFEASPLSKANFCALKGIDAAALDAALTQAKLERGPSKG